MKRRTGYVFEERYMWHDPGSIGGSMWVEPTEFWENSFTKRRVHNLLAVSGVLEQLVAIRARSATKEEITRFHTERYHDQIVYDSARNGGQGGELVPFAKGAYEIASLSAGGLLAATEAVLRGDVDNAYCLVRPPGHHAEADRGRGFCLFNNVVLAVLHARTLSTDNKIIQKVAIVDYDVHHGNGTQDAFYNDKDCLFISLHQDCNYPQDSGFVEDIGGEGAEGYNINLPLPPGSGSGAYSYAFKKVVIPALHRFQPDMIFVSSGFDASYADPLAAMILSSEDFRSMATSLQVAAEELCGGRIIFAHEGGYSKDYVPFCALAVIEAISGIESPVEDHCLSEVKKWGYQDCQAHQAALVNKVAEIHNLTDTTKSNDSNVESNSVSSTMTAVTAKLSDIEFALVTQLQSMLNSTVIDPERRKAVLQSLSY